MKDNKPRFSGGSNIAIKIPKYKYADAVRFYKDIIKLPYKGKHNNSHCFEFGQVTLWLDEVENYSQTDIWLELNTDDTDKAIEYLEQEAIPRRDELEPLEDIEGHWISDPAGVIHLLIKKGENAT